MDSTTARCFLQDALAVFVVSNVWYSDLCYLLNRLGVGRVATTQSVEWVEEEEFWEVVEAKEDGIVLLAPTTMYLAASIGPTLSRHGRHKACRLRENPFAVRLFCLCQRGHSKSIFEGGSV